MAPIGYIPFGPTRCSTEAGWLQRHLATPVPVVPDGTTSNAASSPLPSRARIDAALGVVRSCDHVVVEGPAGLLWSVALRAAGFAGHVTTILYLNPTCWRDVAAVTTYAANRDPTRDHAFVGSASSAAVYGALGVATTVGEPFGIDDARFRPGCARNHVRAELGIGTGPMVLYVGRAEPDKDLYATVRVGMRAQVLFPDLQIVLAAHVLDDRYLAPLCSQLGPEQGVHVVRPADRQLLELYRDADVYLTASTSHFETFGRAPIEALASGTPVVAPAYDGFAETLRQPGGRLVPVDVDDAGAPHVDEAAALRAVYDALTTPADPEAIAMPARARYGRTHTLDLLNYLVGESDLPEPTTVPAASVPLPPEWEQPLRVLADQRRQGALDWLWNECPHRELELHSVPWRLAVRRALCRVTTDVEETVACR